MKKIILLSFAALLGSIAFAKEPVFPRAWATEAKWWQVKKGIQPLSWTDIHGRTNTSQRAVGAEGNVRFGSTHSGDMFVTDKDFNPLTYTVGHATRDAELTWPAPGEYDVSGGVIWTNLSVEEKTARWDAYEAQVESNKVARYNRRYGPAKFDVSLTPEQFKAKIMEGRTEDDLTRAEAREINRQLHEYQDEWTRINDPENWEPLELMMMRMQNGMERGKTRERVKINRRKNWR